ncbi:MAG: hypothetical protein JXP34_17170, partial [Planctomycetes bacterium]|nr:hypothetical protein [Planctomycetota bacterium]
MGSGSARVAAAVAIAAVVILSFAGCRTPSNDGGGEVQPGGTTAPAPEREATAAEDGGRADQDPPELRGWSEVIRPVVLREIETRKALARARVTISGEGP